MDRLDIPEPGGTRRRHARVPRLFSEQRHEHRAAERTHRQVLRLYLAALPLPGVVDARRYGGTAPRRCRDHGRDAPLDHATPQAAAADGGGCAGRPGGGCGARPRAGTRSTAALLESARRVCRRPCIRASGPVQRRDWRGARREARRRPARVQSCRPARARAHPQSRRRDHVLHARGLVRVPPGRRHPLHRHASGRRTAAEGHVAAGRTRAPRLPDAERRPPFTRGLRRLAGLGAGRARRCSATRARRPPAPEDGPVDTRPEHASRSCPPARGTRRHAPALPSRRSRRVRRRPDRDDCVRQRQAASLQLRVRPVRLVLPRGPRPGAARRRHRGRSDLAGGLCSSRGRPRARIALGRRPRPRRRVRTRAGSRTRADRHPAGHASAGARQHRRPPLGRGARCGPRAHRRLDPDERVVVASRARRPPAAARANGGPAHRRHRAHRVHGHLLDRPRATAQPRGLARSVLARAPAGRTRRSGPFRSVSGSSSWTASCW